MDRHLSSFLSRFIAMETNVFMLQSQDIKVFFIGKISLEQLCKYLYTDGIYLGAK